MDTRVCFKQDSRENVIVVNFTLVITPYTRHREQEQPKSLEENPDIYPGEMC